eukprot:gene5930-4241_t
MRIPFPMITSIVLVAMNCIASLISPPSFFSNKQTNKKVVQFFHQPIRLMSANPSKGPSVMANIIIQCSEGRFDLQVDIATSLREAKRAFKRGFNSLGDFYDDEAATLKSLGIEGESQAVFFLVKKKDVPALNVTDAE